MPRKSRPEKRKVAIPVNGTPVEVTLHPPSGTRTSWYAYWPGLVSSRSTGQADLQAAIRAVEGMLRNGGQRAELADAVLGDDEFERIQRVHFGRKADPADQARAASTLEGCLEAIEAFKAISGLAHVTAATPDDCARFQRDALKLPVNWRKKHPKSKATDKLIRPNTVVKWSRMLQAAYGRADRNAGKKCVRGVVPEDKLMTGNPWTRFTWVEGTDPAIRQFDAGELLSFLTHLEGEWPGVPVAALAAKVFLWSCCRKLEVAGLTWESLRLVKDEVHFEVVGKWGVERWFRIPNPLYRDLLAQRTASPFVFAAYSDQIRRVHAGNPGCLRKIRPEFDPDNFGRWLYQRMKEWSAEQPGGDACVHVFRKTALQFAHDGEDGEASQRVAADAGVSEGVLLGHYVRPKLWRKSNRTFRRILAGLPPEVVSRYGHAENDRTRLEREIEAAKDAGDWTRVAELATRLGSLGQSDGQKAG